MRSIPVIALLLLALSWAVYLTQPRPDVDRLLLEAEIQQRIDQASAAPIAELPPGLVEEDSR